MPRLADSGNQAWQSSIRNSISLSHEQTIAVWVAHAELALMRIFRIRQFAHFDTSFQQLFAILSHVRRIQVKEDILCKIGCCLLQPFRSSLSKQDARFLGSLLPLPLRQRQLHRHLLHNLDIKSFQPCDPARMISQQPNPF